MEEEKTNGVAHSCTNGKLMRRSYWWEMTSDIKTRSILLVGDRKWPRMWRLWTASMSIDVGKKIVVNIEPWTLKKPGCGAGYSAEIICSDLTILLETIVSI